ncbi:PPE domain-containing protein [Mycobacterium sp. M1]|uniref:PPE domain-containing protein n=1 Tax=Mycolicibacter acidiphilus TaxID=2835306 RepID=A0ABS5RJZ2_9MYCO|nr:PPE domain-containing protein [Mycolicibacter acidiphilus]MBS9534524.1 PPE domain-containing protein [Mycolicibacter acidiphilus]
MDFGLLPPEVNSGRMYAGPGSTPLITAASAWDGLAAELGSSAAAYQSVLAELEAEWTGPSSGVMAASASRYVTWLQGTAGLAEQTAGRARSAAAAYESAFAAMIPPPAIEANRSVLAALVAGNVLGQNTPAIAATEAAYAAMWAQDALAMYGYAAASVGTTALTPFAPPPQTTNPAGGADQAGAVGQAGANQAQKLTTALSSAMQGLAGPGTAGSAAVEPMTGALSAAAADPALSIAYAGLMATLFGVFVIDTAGSFGIDSAGSFGIDFIGLDVPALLAGGPQLAAALPAAGLGSAPVAAAVGQAAPLGGLSVPPAWTAKAPPPVQFASTTTALAGAGDGAGDFTGDGPGISFGELATVGAAAGMLSTAVRGRAGKGGSPRRRVPGQVRGAVTGIAPELRELAELHRTGILTEAEFAEQKRLLLGH